MLINRLRKCLALIFLTVLILAVPVYADPDDTTESVTTETVSESEAADSDTETETESVQETADTSSVEQTETEPETTPESTTEPETEAPTETEPVSTEASTETPTEPTPESIPNLVFEEGILDTHTIARSGFSSGITQVLIGYLFSDGSFDPWFTAPGFAVNSTTVITSPDASISYSGSIYQAALQEKASGYARLGISLSDYNSIGSNIVYRVYDGNSLLPASRISGVNENGHFTILSVKGMLGGHYKLFETGVTEDMEAYAVGIVKDAVTPHHLFQKNDVVEQILTVDGISANGTITYTMPSTEYFLYCPIVNKDGTLTGVTEGEAGSACSAETVKGILNALGIQYETSLLLPDPVDYFALDRALDTATKVDESLYTEESVQKFIEARDYAQTTRDREGVTQEEADGAASVLNGAISMLEEKPKTFPYGILIAAIIAVLVLAAAAMFIVLVLRKRKELAEYGDDTDKFGKDPSAAEEVLKDLKNTISGLFRKKEKKASEKKPLPQKVKKEKKPKSSPAQKPNREKEEDMKNTRPEKEAEEEVFEEENPTQLLEKSEYRIRRQKTGETVDILHTPFTIGRKTSGVDFVITGNDTVGRIHAKITEEDGIFYLEDLKSLNGTFIDDEQLKPGIRAELADGTIFTVSDEVMIFERNM